MAILLQQKNFGPNVIYVAGILILILYLYYIISFRMNGWSMRACIMLYYYIYLDYFTENRNKIYESRPVFPDTAGLTTVVSSNTGKVKSNGFDVSRAFSELKLKPLYPSSAILLQIFR